MIAIIDYQMGNLRSVQKALEQVGHEATITGDPQVIAAAEKLVLPGVGAFADAIGELKARGLDAPLKASIAAGKPFLGICLGLQLLFERSSENGEHQGLGILPGEVRRFVVPPGTKVPHMGWNQVHTPQPSPLFAGIEDQTHFYFVHSYYVVPTDPQIVVGEASYPEPFCAAIAQGALFATQFHPEKSQAAGLHLLKNFAEL
jgi:glutamine amidotransferase